ncbi:hypothetical protein LRS10_16885 [Phenylobacterium sp. J426]|uniref:hypothetical protein n=1 Tax=Phenylobacterium sp. J426 TaxID=2898439 RepID=UPI002151377D|nr:hypothetical protein [Phenylobacterium sp. J426]MCR5875693.1 hypothetical protein [Phenylobacterium sp. J426]
MSKRTPTDAEVLAGAQGGYEHAMSAVPGHKVPFQELSPDRRGVYESNARAVLTAYFVHVDDEAKREARRKADGKRGIA